MSPTAEVKVVAVMTLTTGTLISRRTSGERLASIAIARSSASISLVRKSTCRSPAVTASRSSVGSSMAVSQARPALPNRSSSAVCL